VHPLRYWGEPVNDLFMKYGHKDSKSAQNSENDVIHCRQTIQSTQ
jgi:hypothetical protein